jgi:hypothetical protein
MDTVGTARALVEIGAFLLAVMGAFHAAMSLADDFKPRRFTPQNDDVRRRMNETSVRISRRSNMWKAWIGFNISHGLGAFAFGAIFFLIALHDFHLLTAFKPLMLLGVCVSLAYFLTALRYWFYVPAIGTGIGFACFAAAYALV